MLGIFPLGTGLEDGVWWGWGVSLEAGGLCGGNRGEGKWRSASGLFKELGSVTSSSTAVGRSGRRCLNCPPAAKEREVCSGRRHSLDKGLAAEQSLQFGTCSQSGE